LAETVVAVAIVGIVVVTVIGSLATAVRSTGRQRVDASAEALLRSSAEALKNPAVPYAGCATASTYAPRIPADPQGRVTAHIVAVEFWNGATPASFSSVCSSDRGAQLIRLEVRGDDGKVVAADAIVKRRLNP
jgi:hypothetical protein